MGHSAKIACTRIILFALTCLLHSGNVCCFELLLVEGNSEKSTRSLPVKLFLLDGKNDDLYPIAKFPSTTGSSGGIESSSMLSRGYLFSTSAGHQGLDYLLLNDDFAVESYPYWVPSTQLGKIFQVSSFGARIVLLAESGIYSHDLYPTDNLHHLYWDIFDFKKIFNGYAPNTLLDYSNSLEINKMGVWFLDPQSNILYHYSDGTGESKYHLKNLDGFSTFTVIEDYSSGELCLVYGNNQGCHLRDLAGTKNITLTNKPCLDLVAGLPHLAVLHMKEEGEEKRQFLSLVNMDHPNFPYKSYKIPSRFYNYSQVVAKKNYIFHNSFLPNFTHLDFHNFKAQYIATEGFKFSQTFDFNAEFNFQTYQWVKDGIPITPKLSFRHDVQLQIDVATQTDNGNYWMVMESFDQRAVSPSFMLKVVEPELNIHSLEISDDSQFLDVYYVAPSKVIAYTLQHSFDLKEWRNIEQITPTNIGLNTIQFSITESPEEGFLRIIHANN